MFEDIENLNNCINILGLAMLEIKNYYSIEHQKELKSTDIFIVCTCRDSKEQKYILGTIERDDLLFEFSSKGYLNIYSRFEHVELNID